MSYLETLTSTGGIVLQDAYSPFPAPPAVAGALGVTWLGGMDLKAATAAAQPGYSLRYARGVFADVRFTRIDAGTLACTAQVTNMSQGVVPRVCLSLPLPVLAGAVRSNMTEFGTIRPEGWRGAAPCAERPYRAFYRMGGAAGIGIVPEESGPRVLANCWPGTGRIHLWFDRMVKAGETATVRFTVTEGGADVAALLKPWWERPRAVRYVGTAWPVAQANLATPAGFKETWAQWAARVPGVAAGGVKCLQMWDQAGYQEPSYSPDMLGIWPGTGVEMMDFARELKEAGLRVGYGCRPGASIEAARARKVVDRAGSVSTFLSQLKACIPWGVTDLYADSFGSFNGNAGGALYPAEATDGEFSRAIRRELLMAGIGSPSIAEVSTAATWESMGGYVACRWTGTGFVFGGPEGGNLNQETLELVRRAFPGFHAQAQLCVPAEKVPAAIDFCGSRRVVPMVQWTMVPAMAKALAAYVAAYVDEASGGWK